MLLCDVKNSAIEINQKAANQLQASGDDITIYNQSILDFKPDYSRDLVLASGILIHLDPENLPRVYELMFQSSHRYICIAEYYNPTPVEVPYRGHQNKMFKRDFAGEMLDKFQDLRLLDYGFVYHRDTQFPQDDVNWFLLEKISRKL
jgi:spore coat polysaccharide biosynthesis protein SpsF